MTNKHTPAPWRYKDRTRVYRKKTIDNHFSIYGEQSGIDSNIVRVFKNAAPEEAEANARLIAAAPELLEAAKAFAEIAAITKPNCGIKLRTLIQQVQEKHLAAIAKAEGK